MTTRGSTLPVSPRKISEVGKPRTRIDDESSIEKDYNYKIGDELGRGSFGVVKEVKDTKTGTSYAMKTINKDKPGSMMIQLLDREIMVLNRIDHPHLIKLIEIFENDKKVFIILEMCRGGELSDELKRKGKLSEDETRVVMRQLAEAVVHLHTKDIVHRDLKLENILLSTELTSDPYNIKVSDFGLAHMKAVDGDSDNSMHSRCGTLFYMAPEVLRNKHEYSQLCDVWSMGVIMYALLCGRMPFNGDNTAALEESIMSGNLKFKEPEWISISEKAKHLVEGMLTPDTVNRYTARRVSRNPWITGRTDEEEFDPFKMLMDDSPTSSPPTRPHSDIFSDPITSIQTTKDSSTGSSLASSTTPISKPHTPQRSKSLSSRTTQSSTSKLTTPPSKSTGMKKSGKTVSSGQLLRPSTGLNGMRSTHDGEKKKLPSSAKR